MPALPVRGDVYRIVVSAVRLYPLRWSDITLRAALSADSLDPATVVAWLDEMEALLSVLRRSRSK